MKINKWRRIGQNPDRNKVVKVLGPSTNNDENEEGPERTGSWLTVWVLWEELDGATGSGPRHGGRGQSYRPYALSPIWIPVQEDKQ